MTYYYGYGGGYGGGGGYSSPSYDYSSPSYYAPPYYAPEPVYYAPPVYEPPTVYAYEPPSYSYTPPSYSYTPPDYSYTPPSYTPPDIYDFTPPSYEPYVSPYSPPPAYESWGAPSRYDLYQEAYDAVNWEDPYGLTPEGGNGDAYNRLQTIRDQDIAATYGELIRSGGDPSGGGGDYGGSDVYDYGSPYDSGSPAYSGSDAYDYGSPFDSNYFSSPASDSNYFSSPASDSNYFTPSDTSGIASLPSGPQFASNDYGNYGAPNVVSDSSELGKQAGVNTGNTRSMYSGSGDSGSGANSGAGISLNSDGSSVVTTANGEKIEIADSDTQRLLRGEVTLAQLAAQDTTDRLSPTTVAARDGLTLEQPAASDVKQVYAQGSDGVPSLPPQGGFELLPPQEKDPDAPYGRNPMTGGAYANDPNVAQAEMNSAQRENPEITPMSRQRSEDIANFLTTNAKPGEPDAIEFMNAANEWTGNKASNVGTVAQSLQISGLTEQEISKELQSMYGLDKYGADHAANLAAIGQNREQIARSLTEMGYGPNFQGPGVFRPGTPGAPDFKEARRAAPAASNMPKINAKAESGKGGGGGGGQQQQQKKSGVGSAALMAALAAMLAGNKGKGGSGAGIAGLGLDRTRNALDNAGRRAGSDVQKYFTGPGLKKMADGGIAGLPNPLGGYSDGGRLLKGPGDGVSDSIPAMIGKKQPARLADGEFVVPARIVSELGNGSTEAGARQLYAMMDRVQRDRKKSVGKGKVAVNSRAKKHLPA